LFSKPTLGSQIGKQTLAELNEWPIGQEQDLLSAYTVFISH